MKVYLVSFGIHFVEGDQKTLKQIFPRRGSLYIELAELIPSLIEESTIDVNPPPISTPEVSLEPKPISPENDTETNRNSTEIPPQNV
ncbi:MAG: hypothetical protein ACK42K_12045 [Leptonema sp. (in: bacteria)]